MGDWPNQSGPLTIAGTAVVASQTANYTLTPTDGIVLADSSGGTFTLTLPAASGNGGRIFIIKKIDSSSTIVTIGRTGSDTIDGATSATLTTQYQALTVISNGTNWYIV